MKPYLSFSNNNINNDDKYNKNIQEKRALTTAQASELIRTEKGGLVHPGTQIQQHTTISYIKTK